MVKEITQAPKSVYWRLIYRIWINNINFKLIFHFTITISKSTLQSDYKEPSNFKNHFCGDSTIKYGGLFLPHVFIYIP